MDDIETTRAKVLEGAALLQKAWKLLSEVDCFIGIGDENGVPYIHLSDFRLHGVRFSDMFEADHVVQREIFTESVYRYGDVDIIAIVDEV